MAEPVEVGGAGAGGLEVGVRVELGFCGSVGQCPGRCAGRLSGGGGRFAAAKEVEDGLGAVVAAGRRELFEVPDFLPDNGPARASGLDGATDEQQSVVEDRVRAGLVGVVEEGAVNQTEAVLRG